MATTRDHDSHDPSRDLNDLESARARLASRMVTPWWYKALAGLITAVMFLGVGMTLEGAPWGSMTTGLALVVMAAAGGPGLLLALLKRSTGMAVDRYADGLGGWYIAVFALLAVGVALHLLAGLTWALFVLAIPGFLATVLLEHRIDARWAERADTTGHSA